MTIHSGRGHTCSECKGKKTLLAEPLQGKYAESCAQIRIRKNIVLVGFGHKLKKRISPPSWAQHLHDGDIYAYGLKSGFALIPTRCLKHVHGVLGSGFVQVDQGILVASTEVVLPKISKVVVGVRVGVDQHGDDVVVLLTCSKDGAKRLRASLPSYMPHAHTPLPDATA